MVLHRVGSCWPQTRPQVTAGDSGMAAWAARRWCVAIKNIPWGAGDVINVSAVYTDGASRYNFQDLVPTTFAMYGGTSALGAYQSVAFAGVADTVFSGTSFLNGTSQQKVQTWGMRGGYTHNWDPTGTPRSSVLMLLSSTTTCLRFCSAQMLQRWRCPGPGFPATPTST